MIKGLHFSKFVEEVPSSRTLIDADGREVLDNKPVSIPFKPASAPASMMELMHRLYQQMQADGHDVETFQDAEDFDVDDEVGIELQDTPYEQNFDHLAGNPAPTPEPVPVPNEPEPQKVTE